MEKIFRETKNLELGVPRPSSERHLADASFGLPRHLVKCDLILRRRKCRSVGWFSTERSGTTRRCWKLTLPKHRANWLPNLVGGSGCLFGFNV